MQFSRHQDEVQLWMVNQVRRGKDLREPNIHGFAWDEIRNPCNEQLYGRFFLSSMIGGLTLDDVF